MNFQRSDDELRFESQQIEDARLDADGAPPNIFAAALGLAGIVATIALISLLWSIAETLIRVVHNAVVDVSFLLKAVHSVFRLDEARFGPHAEILIVIVVVTTSVFACASLRQARSAISTFARRRRA